MTHEHHHHDHHHEHHIESLSAIYYFSIALNLTFVIVEAIIGIAGNSLGLISDAGHNLGDTFSLLLALIAFKLAASRSNRRFTYGYKKSSVLISLVNALILLVAVGAIIVESIHKFSAPAPVNGTLVIWTAALAIVVNGVTALLLSKQSHHDINTRGAFLHMLMDTLVSVGVLVSGVIINLTGWTLIDPIISLVIAAVILGSTWSLLSESVRMSIDAVPSSVDIDSVEDALRSQPGVSDVHHIHIWAISTEETALTAHIVIDDITLSDDIRGSIQSKLESLGITHSTIQTESSPCRDHIC